MMANQSGLVSACWLLTSRCNYICTFCFKVPNRKDISQKQAEKILFKLKKAGVKKITFSGGEPLLWSGDIFDLIRQAKRLGIITMIITNGSLLSENRLTKLRGNLDWITLPIDGSNEKNQVKAGRPPGHFTRVLNLLNKIKDSSFKIKINTVLNRKNLDDIKNIAKLIKKHQIIKRWKIFQFFPIRDASLTNRKIHEITEKQFRQAERKIKKMFKDHDCKIYFGSNKDLEASYFTIAPDGIVYISKSGKDINLGDLKRQSAKKIWNRATLIDKDKYWDRTSWFIE